jgi:hypothetical protein
MLTPTWPIPPSSVWVHANDSWFFRPMRPTLRCREYVSAGAWVTRCSPSIPL